LAWWSCQWTGWKEHYLSFSPRVISGKNIPITFQSVAKHARVSKTILYADDKISDQIRQCRDKASVLQRMLDQQRQLDKKNVTISNLNKRIEYLNSEVQRLKSQLEIVYGELYSKTQYCE